MVLLGVSLPQLVLLPPLVLLAAGVALYNFQNLFRFLSVGGSLASRAIFGIRSFPLSHPTALLLLLLLLSLTGLKDYMTIPIVQTLRPCAY